MKKSTKVLLIIASVCLALGVALGVTGLVNGASRWIYADAQGVHVVRESTRQLNETLPAFSAMEVDLKAPVSVRVVASDHFGLSCTYREDLPLPEYTVAEGKLRLWDKAYETPQSSFYWFNLNLGEPRSQDTLTLYVPAGTVLTLAEFNLESADLALADLSAEQLQVKATYGSLSLDNISSHGLDIQNKHGTVSLNQVSAHSLRYENAYASGYFNQVTVASSQPVDMTTSHGDLYLTAFTAPQARFNSQYGRLILTDSQLDSLSATTDHGDVQLMRTAAQQACFKTLYGDIHLEQTNLSDLKAQSTQGAIYYQGALSGNAEATSEYSDIRIELSDALSGYNYNLASTYGLLHMGDNKMERYFQQDNGQAYTLTLKSTHGDILVSGQGG